MGTINFPLRHASGRKKKRKKEKKKKNAENADMGKIICIQTAPKSNISWLIHSNKGS